MNEDFLRIMGSGIKPNDDTIITNDLHTVIWATPPDGLKYLVAAFGPDGDTLCMIPNSVSFRSKNPPNLGFSVSSRSQHPLYGNGGRLFYKGSQNNDTIWELKLPQPEIHAVINMGKYKLPVEYRPDYSKPDFDKNAGKYYCVPRINEDDRYFFYLVEPWTAEYAFRMVFDKQTGEGFAVRNGAFGITDDLLHGLPFWPNFLSGEYYIMTVEAYELIERLAGTESAYFKKLLSTIDENSNQLLVLCKKKARKAFLHLTLKAVTPLAVHGSFRHGF